jgi:lipid II:glycine glycyltransferase (peptidoglycan interpeptide bridge formation enzyme)
MLKMAEIRIANENDKKEWNKVAYQSPDATYAHTWEWKEVVEKGLGLSSIYLVAEDGNEIVGIYPAFLKPKIENFDNWKVNNYLSNKFQILWSPLDLTWDYGGPCIIPGSKEQIINELIIEMENFCKKTNALDIKTSPFSENISQYFVLNKYKEKERLTYVIDLSKSEEELWGRIQKSARRYINKAKTNDLEFFENNSENGIKTLYDSMVELKERENICIPAYSFFEIILDEMVPKNLAKFYTIKYKTECIGGALVFGFKDVVTFRYGVTNEKYRNLYPHYLMHWKRIQQSKSTGYKIIDFGGMPSDKNNGIYIFKSKWGGEIRNVNWYSKYIKYNKIRNLKNSIIKSQ